MRRSIPGLVVRHEDLEVESATTLTRAGPYTVVFASVVSPLGAELHSIDLGHPAVETRAVHLELGRDGHARIDAADHAPQELPVTYALERLLLDHAMRLRDLVAELSGGSASVDVTDEALAVSHRRPPRPGHSQESG